MNVFVFWNRRDHDSAKMYKFVKDLFVPNGLSTHTFFFYPMWEIFTLSGQMREDLEKSDIVLLFTHGSSQQILKSKKTYVPLLCQCNASLLSGKKVVALCCSSAKGFGLYCTKVTSICDLFVGFKDDLYYAEYGLSEKYRHFAYTVYNSAFKKAFEYALDTSCSSEEFAFHMRRLIKQEIVAQALNARDRSLGDQSKYNYIEHSADGFIALGNTSKPLFA